MRRKLRIMIITGGGDRQRCMEELFEALLDAHPDALEPPVYSPAVSSRSLRNRYELLRMAHLARLIPESEWQAIEAARRDNNDNDNNNTADPKRFFDDILRDVPVTEGRRGRQEDTKLHYSEELWRKAKGLNRGRAVLACTFAHLIALPRFVDEDFDLMLEDNVRAPLDFVERIWQIVEASDDWSTKTGDRCHLRYYGWLGSIPNLRWIYESHIPTRSHRLSFNAGDGSSRVAVFPFPTKHDIEADLAQQKTMNESSSPSPTNVAHRTNEEAHGAASKTSTEDREPGGNAIWGSYGYWMSREGYNAFLSVLQNDVGALLWKPKRARYYYVKPIDKIMPRLILQHMSCLNSVHLPSHPVVFRAPMLTSKIHTQWDPEFCRSTEFQLHTAGLVWNDLWLSEPEQAVVEHHERTRKWVTLNELQERLPR